MPWPETWPDLDLPTDAVALAPIAPDDIDEDFSNIEDLEWLRPIARDHRMVLLGESHYFRGTYWLAHRVLFALNTFDHYGVLTLEYGYWQGPLFDHYVSLSDRDEARAFRDEVLRPVSFVEETLTLLEHIRRWNMRNPQKRIRVICHDVNHDWKAALRHVVLPYFESHDPTRAGQIDVDALELEDLESTVAMLEGWLRSAKGYVPPDRPYLTPAHIRATLANFAPLKWKGGPFFDEDFFAYRQEAIIRNLTDLDRAGRLVRRHKVMLWGGGYHTPTRMNLPSSARFLREGAYFSQQFEPTRGRVYSVFTGGYAYSFADVASLDVSACESTGLRSLIESFQEIHTDPEAPEQTTYMFQRDGFLEFVIGLAPSGPTGSKAGFIHLERVDWEALLEGAKGDASLEESIRYNRSILAGHDQWVIMPRSPIVRPVCPG